MLIKEYRVCMPLTVDEYRIGQLYMISKHSCEQSGGGEGVEVVKNEASLHPQHGAGQLTEKRIYLSSGPEVICPGTVQEPPPPPSQGALVQSPVQTITDMNVPTAIRRDKVKQEKNDKTTRLSLTAAPLLSLLQPSANHCPALTVSKLPPWAKVFVPRFFYVTETAWNFYPYTITEYSVSFLPKFSIRIETRFENNKGNNDNVFGDTPTPAPSVSFLDILSDPIPERHYREAEDLSRWQSRRTGRGPLLEGWRDIQEPIMCSYKRVQCSFEVYGLQSRTEEFLHKNIRDILLVAHRQAVAWTDEWHGLTMEEVRKYEQTMTEKTNIKVKSSQSSTGPAPAPRPVFSRSISCVTDERSLQKLGLKTVSMSDVSTPSHCSTRLNSTPE